MKYVLLATDMDGTAVNDQNRMSPRTEEAIHRALAQGYEVIFSTGRCPAEIRPFLKRFPDMHYAVCTNGSLIMDLRTGIPLRSVVVDPAVVEQALAAIQGMDYTAGFYLGDEFYMDQGARNHLEHYNCACFQQLFEECATWVESGYEVFRKDPSCVRKVNLYFHDPEEHRRAGELFAKLPMNYPSGIPMDYEICPPELSKGAGVELICRHLGISPAQCIACGDAGNDQSMLAIAGLGVAVGSAVPELKAMADVIVADCEHDGLAEAIEAYLGKEIPV